MVDSIGSRPLAPGDLRVVAATRAAAPRDPQTNAATTGTGPRLAAQLASSPPVDTDRVAQIKAAVREGRFPISPATIADRLIALRYEWMDDDKA